LSKTLVTFQSFSKSCVTSEIQIFISEEFLFYLKLNWQHRPLITLVHAFYNHTKLCIWYHRKTGCSGHMQEISMLNIRALITGPIVTSSRGKNV
jgi:hypothetical protein